MKGYKQSVQPDQLSQHQVSQMSGQADILETKT